MNHFTILTSGSRGNAALLEVNGRGLLIDCGCGPRTLTQLLRHIGRRWADVHAVVLTHTHRDHWNDLTFKHLHACHIPVWVHAEHRHYLRRHAESFFLLEKNGLTPEYPARYPFQPWRGLSIVPIEVSHDAVPTFAFRIETAVHPASAASTPRPLTIGYAADLGCASAPLQEALQDCYILALEFNHDVTMQLNSRRPPFLIQRILGDRGHLSNDQAAALLHKILSLSRSPPAYLVQLHLSEECNTPPKARAAAVRVLNAFQATTALITARQHQPSPTIEL